MLQGKVALVTGASRGIGAAIAKELASQGAAVVVNYRGSAEQAAVVVEDICAAGGKAFAVQADVSQLEAAQKLVKETLDRFGRLDILVNNAGTTRDMLLMMMSETDWDVVLQTNLKSAYNCTKSALRPMMKQRFGRIINITSVSGLAGQAGQANYSASKAGLIGFTKAVAKEVAPLDNRERRGPRLRAHRPDRRAHRRAKTKNHRCDAVGAVCRAIRNCLCRSFPRQRPGCLHHRPGPERRWWADHAVDAR